MDSIMSQVNWQEELLEQLMTNYGQDILQLVYTYVRDNALAEDLTQEIFIKCYRALSNYKGQATLKTWLWRIAINHTKDYLKSWHTRHMTVTEAQQFEHLTDNESVEQMIEQQESQRTVIDAVMKLPIKYRELVYLHYFEEYSLQEMAQILKVNRNTLKTRLRKARMLLGEHLEGSFENEFI